MVMTLFPPSDPIVPNVTGNMLGLNQVLEMKVELLKIELKKEGFLMRVRKK